MQPYDRWEENRERHADVSQTQRRPAFQTRPQLFTKIYLYLAG